MAAKAWARGQERSVALMGKADVAKGIAETRQAQAHRLAGAAWPGLLLRRQGLTSRHCGPWPTALLQDTLRTNGWRPLVFHRTECMFWSYSLQILESQILLLLLIGPIWATSAEYHRITAVANYVYSLPPDRFFFFFLKAHTKPKEEEQRAMKKPRYLPPSVSD